ncbi:unnamed protein product [Paramecium pentaurelia]|uniref:Uncharacterized protein n=1 Tax=Paramecium pentaurelia TaxID=43138 RepID=A0A8S1YJE1_9CILI|nr:unnamed protein product [Paramecium pentaurelia]
MSFKSKLILQELFLNIIMMTLKKQTGIQVSANQSILLKQTFQQHNRQSKDISEVELQGSY